MSRFPSGLHASYWACPGPLLAGTWRRAATDRDVGGRQATVSSRRVRSRRCSRRCTRSASRTRLRVRSTLSFSTRARTWRHPARCIGSSPLTDRAASAETSARHARTRCRGSKPHGQPGLDVGHLEARHARARRVPELVLGAGPVQPLPGRVDDRRAREQRALQAALCRGNHTIRARARQHHRAQRSRRADDRVGLRGHARAARRRAEQESPARLERQPISESCFKTIKYQPDYPGRFHGVAHARRWFIEFFDWYANRHRHSGLALFTPADVFFGGVAELADTRQRALDSAYAAHAERFVRGRPTVHLPPANVAINPIDPGAATQTIEEALSASETAAPASRPCSNPRHHRPCCRASARPQHWSAHRFRFVRGSPALTRSASVCELFMRACA
jgi:hypothetical protein